MSGMLADETLHESFLELEPNSGTVIRSAKRYVSLCMWDVKILSFLKNTCCRLQYNFLIQPDIMLWSNATKHVYVPVAWLESTYVASPQVVDALKDIYWWKLTIAIVYWFSLISGCLFLFVAFILSIKTYKLHKDMQGYRIVGWGKKMREKIITNKCLFFYWFCNKYFIFWFCLTVVHSRYVSSQSKQ